MRVRKVAIQSENEIKYESADVSQIICLIMGFDEVRAIKLRWVRFPMIKVSWKVVFHLPKLSAAITVPCSTAIWRNPVTINSLPIMVQVIQIGQ